MSLQTYWLAIPLIGIGLSLFGYLALWLVPSKPRESQTPREKTVQDDDLDAVSRSFIRICERLANDFKQKAEVYEAKAAEAERAERHKEPDLFSHRATL